MSFKIPNFVVKGIAYSGMAYLTYSLFTIASYEKQAKKLEAYKQNKQAIGEQVVLNEEQQKIQEYLDNHYGQKLLERMQTQHLLEEQIQFAIQTKKELKDKLQQSDNNSQEIIQIEDEIQKMNELFTKVQTKKKVLKDTSLIKTN